MSVPTATMASARFAVTHNGARWIGRVSGMSPAAERSVAANRGAAAVRAGRSA